MSDRELTIEVSAAANGLANVAVLLGSVPIHRDTIDLRKAKDRERFALAVYRELPGLPEGSIQVELLAIDPERLPRAVAGPDDPWPDPEPIDRPTMPPFPVDALPEPLGAWVVAVSEATQTPADLAGLLGLAVCAGAVARRLVVEAGRGWVEPLCLYVAVLLDPGNRKSAVFSEAMRPLRLFERELAQAAAPEIARLRADRRIKEAALKAAEKKAAGGCGESHEMARELAETLESEPIPAVPKLIVDDATAEAVENHLASQGGRLVVAGCEGGLFDVMAGRYSSGVGNLDVYLKGHAGDDLRVDRVIRGSMVVERCCLSLAYAVQPEVIRGLAERPSFRGRGLIGRFLYSIPESPLGRRRIDTEPVPEAVSAAYADLVRRLAVVPDYDPPGLITLSPEAARRFRGWQAEVESMLGDGGRFEAMRDWGGKLCGATARLAAILHLIGNVRPEPWRDGIGVDAIESAIEVSRWAVPHAEAVIRLMAAADGPLDDARYVLRWLRESGRAEVTRRDVHVHGRSRFDGEPERLDIALGQLIDRGWLRPLETVKGSGRGRQPSPRFATHPLLRGDGPGDEPLPVDPAGRERGTL